MFNVTTLGKVYIPRDNQKRMKLYNVTFVHLSVCSFLPEGILQSAWLTGTAGKQAESYRLTGLRNKKTEFETARENKQ